MFKVLILHNSHNFSNDATEEQIIDRTSFKNFRNLPIGDEIPNAKTLWTFKQRIEAFAQLFENKLIPATETKFSTPALQTYR